MVVKADGEKKVLKKDQVQQVGTALCLKEIKKNWTIPRPSMDFKHVRVLISYS